MKIPFIPNINFPDKAKFIGKILIGLILSVLLLAPQPAFALDYSGTLNSYVSNVKVELDGVLTSIQKLPSLSYQNGKTTLAEIDNKLHKIQTDAGKNAADFQKLSNEAQQEYEKMLAKINAQQSVLNAFIGQLTPVASNQPRIQNGRGPLVTTTIQVNGMDDIVIEGGNLDKVMAKFDNDKRRISNAIALTNKISKLSENLEKRVILAKQKTGNVRDYADALESFSDPDILVEINELDKFIADLTNNLPVAS
ncbi:hypothetical protein HCG51_07185 [Tolypothrix sp. PCC 7910]|uniref:hypothetical protein n=1 Tax=Tolypothrix sp. PCC 7910 TaxID=2099387 RepID=UPI0014278FDE|nr:hypothetical protein [Tolypothrix sp. PCC 7910]QIR36556.1 hypothetical protein HCG51_07185 [Tolypothrix sp. PCC 7910]